MIPGNQQLKEGKKEEKTKDAFWVFFCRSNRYHG